MGVLVAFVLMLAAGLAGFLPLVTVFIITVLATRWGYGRKQQLGVAERGRGRTASQVLANLGATTLCALPVVWFPRIYWRPVDRRNGGAGRSRRRYRFQRNRTSLGP